MTRPRKEMTNSSQLVRMAELMGPDLLQLVEALDLDPEQFAKPDDFRKLVTLDSHPDLNLVAVVTPAELMTMLKAFTSSELTDMLTAWADDHGVTEADHSGLDAIPRRGHRSSKAPSLPPGWSQPYWPIIDG